MGKNFAEEKTLIKLRYSHLMSYCGIGSVFHGHGNKLITIKDISHWDNRSTTPINFIERITSSLKISKKLKMPNRLRNIVENKSQYYIPATIFPTYTKCKSCGYLHYKPWRKQNTEPWEQCYCEKCNNPLEQVTWCLVSDKGHLDDVPWHAICHIDSKNQCRWDNEGVYLKLKTSWDGKAVVYCDRCNAQHFYENLDVSKLELSLKPQPWIFPAAKVPAKDDIRISLVEINDPRVYLPVSISSIVIPPESRIRRNSIVDKLYTHSRYINQLNRATGSIDVKRSIQQRIAQKLKCTVEELQLAIEEINSGKYSFKDDESGHDLKYQEYKALLTPLDDVDDYEDFVTEHRTEEWKNLVQKPIFSEFAPIIHSITNLIAVKRLREIQIFKGFYRYSTDKDSKLIPPDLNGQEDWLPAVELFGEGIFFTLNTNLINKWEMKDQVSKRAAEFAERNISYGFNHHQDLIISPRFILLHTLSHLIMRELETAIGYPSASLKERIYFDTINDMAGILIYISVPDMIGSLGGLLQIAEPETFFSLFKNSLNRARWCSLDPVCSENEGQGPGWLNKAACHACTLLPETTCCYNNVFLDRTFIYSNAKINFIGLFDKILGKN